jgi:imidazolonepropionase
VRRAARDHLFLALIREDRLRRLIRNARVLTLAGGSRPRRGREMSDLGVIPRGDVLVENGVIAAVGEHLEAADAEVVDAGGRVLMPALIDCHTHACFAGDRLDEWEMKRRGATYLEILQRGGGIMSTVRAVRAAGEDDLVRSLVERIGQMQHLGTTTVEVKSGYGLDAATELKMLRAIDRAAKIVAPRGVHVVPTALLGHAIDADAPGTPAEFVERTIRETLPAVSKEFPGIAVDAYCENGAWSLEDCRRLFERARELGHPCRVHADQFNSLGIIDLNTQLGEPGRPLFRTIDHLEATAPPLLERLAESGTIGVLLPCAGFHTDGRYADGRRLIDAGGAVAVATNCNPGSAPCLSVPMAVALAVRFNGLSVAEAITAVTVNAAAACGLADRGAIAPGQRADLLLLNTTDERRLAHDFGASPVAALFPAAAPAITAPWG